LPKWNEGMLSNNHVLAEIRILPLKPRRIILLSLGTRIGTLSFALDDEGDLDDKLIHHQLKSSHLNDGIQFDLES